MQALLELLGVGVAELDERGVVGFANPVFSALAGGGRGAEADRLRERLATEGMKVASGQGIVEWVDEATGLAVRLSPGGRGEDGAPLVLGLLCREAMDPEALEKCRAGLRDRAGLITPQLAGAAAAGQMPPEVARAVMVEHEIRGLEHILDGLVPVSGGEPEGGLRLLRAVESMVWLLRTERDRAGGSTAGGIEAVELLRELSETWAPLAKRKGLRWSCQCRLPKTERIPGEPAVLRMVLGNLIDNAIRSTPSGDVQVMVRVTGSGVLLQVADTGPGFPSRDRELLFEWFERGAAGRGEAGWGVGLSLCRELVGGLGGAIRLSARPGGGSRVRVFLPDPER
ncbi:MAG: sensor histidine kinase, partial [Puniceicoccaceae bacterium]